MTQTAQQTMPPTCWPFVEFWFPRSFIGGTNLVEVQGGYLSQEEFSARERRGQITPLIDVPSRGFRYPAHASGIYPANE